MDENHFTGRSKTLKRDTADSDLDNFEEGSIQDSSALNSKRTAKIKYSRMKRKVLRHVWLLRISILLGIAAVFIGLTYGVFKLFEDLGVGNIFILGYDFISAPVDQIASTGGRTNILVLGKAGGARSYDSPDLTDTILVVSVGLTKPDIAMVSIPRDVWIPDMQAKINSAYYWGKQKNVGGISFAKSITGEVTGEPIQYGVVIDFSSFKDIIDTLGGIQVNVKNGFTDKLYPIAGRENDTCGGDPTFACRYMTVTFNPGLQTMDGDTALIFVRSRHAEGDEGTDIAREARQQLVIDAIKTKLTDPKVFLSPKIDLALFNIMKKYIETDIDPSTMAILGRKILAGSKSINQYLIPENLLINPPINKVYQEQYVFIPSAGNGNWIEINKWFAGVFK